MYIFVLNIFSGELDEAEDLSLPWVVAEDEIRQMIDNPEVFTDSHTDMFSGGLYTIYSKIDQNKKICCVNAQ
jgi:hypothetical protein